MKHNYLQGRTLLISQDVGGWGGAGVANRRAYKYRDAGCGSRRWQADVPINAEIQLHKEISNAVPVPISYVMSGMPLSACLNALHFEA